MSELTYEVLRPDWLLGNARADSIATAVGAGLFAARREVRFIADRPSGDADVVVVWGLGHPKGQELLDEMSRSGVHVLGFDLGYWKRTGPDMRFRLSVDDEHPARRVMAVKRSMSRMLDDGIVVRYDADPKGPIILAGIGHKSAATYGELPGQWEERALARIREAWGDRPVIFRPKPGGGDHAPKDVPVAAAGTIEDLLRGASCVVTRHSNVAVDAIIAGVPAIAEDGAASAVCYSAPEPGRFPPPSLPVATRIQFLANLAWFQWSEAELRLPATWHVIEDIIRSHP